MWKSKQTILNFNNVEVGVCDIYIICDNIVIVVLTMYNLTLSSILQKPNQTPSLRSARIHYVMKFSGLNSARAHLESVLSLHNSVY